MPLSRYPRPGHPLAPATLTEILEQRTSSSPSGSQRVSLPITDLASDAWKVLGPRRCRALADQVSLVLRSSLPALRASSKCPPAPPPGVHLKDLELEPRTYNCLRKAGFSSNLQRLSELTIGEILSLRGFGARCLLDLLTSLEALSPVHVSRPAQHPADVPAEAFARFARQIRRSADIDNVGRDDPRFGHAIREIDIASLNLGELVDRFALHPPAPNTRRAVLLRLEDLRTQIQMALKLSLDKELTAFASLAGGLRNQGIALRQLGWDGHGGATLQEVGLELGLTRERVRQIVARVTRAAERSHSFVPFAPALDRTLSYIDEHVPESAEDLEAALQKEGLVTQPFRLEGVQAAALTLRRDPEFTLTVVGGQRLVVSLQAGSLAALILRAALRATKHWGVATVWSCPGLVDTWVKVPILAPLLLAGSRRPGD